MIKGCWVIFEYMCKMSLMKWFLLNRLQINLEPRKISLEQKYLAFYNPYDPSYQDPDLHRDLKKLTFPNIQLQLHNFWCQARSRLSQGVAKVVYLFKFQNLFVKSQKVFLWLKSITKRFVTITKTISRITKTMLLYKNAFLLLLH